MYKKTGCSPLSKIEPFAKGLVHVFSYKLNVKFERNFWSPAVRPVNCIFSNVLMWNTSSKQPPVMIWVLQTWCTQTSFTSNVLLLALYPLKSLYFNTPQQRGHCLQLAYLVLIFATYIYKNSKAQVYVFNWNPCQINKLLIMSYLIVWPNPFLHIIVGSKRLKVFLL